MDIVVGDLLKMARQGDFDVIVHGCNCFHAMGAGLAKQIAEQYPQALTADITHTVKGDVSKLGTIVPVTVNGDGDHQFAIFNAYTQYRPGVCRKEILYPSIRSAFKQLAFASSKFPLRIGIPMIGCGIAGGDWAEVSKIIDHEMSDILEQTDATLTLVQWG